MKRRPQTVTDAELAVLKILWQRGPLTAKAITAAIYPDGAESEFASVHSFLQRLERKGLIASRLGTGTPIRGGRPRRFYRMKPKGVRALNDARAAVNALWYGLEFPLRGAV